MVFWIGILAGAAFAWFAVKLGFFEMWAMLFNIVISVFLAVYLKPVVANMIPAADETSYGNGLLILSVAVLSFAVLQGLSYVFFTGQFSVKMPKMFDVLGSGVLGFLAGVLIWSFAALLIGVTPISQGGFAKSIGLGSQLEQSNVQYICWWGNLVNKVVASSDSELKMEQRIDKLLKSVEDRLRKSRVVPQPKPVDPNDKKPPKTREEELGPPPEIDI